jgi:hypothetical protein
MTALYLQGRMKSTLLAFNMPELALGLLFAIAFLRTKAQ